jgi:hypothetical protein
MGFFGFLKLRNNQIIPIENHFGLNVGNPLAAFFIKYDAYVLEGRKFPEFDWFESVERNTKYDLRIFLKISYAGEDRHTSFEEDTKNKWGSIDEVINTTTEIVQLLLETEDTLWFTKQNTIPAFEALLDTLKKCKNSGEKEVRIQFL